MVHIAKLNYYELLEIPRNATSADIKRAYRKMAEDYHPDKTMHLGSRLRELANLEMTRINKAKEVLLDDEKRRKYDEYLGGTRTEDLDDIILDVDPLDEFEEENWEELRDEILEVEPLEDVNEATGPEPVVQQVQYSTYEETYDLPEDEETGDFDIQRTQPVQSTRPIAPPQPRFWGRLKKTINDRERIRKRRDAVKQRRIERTKKPEKGKRYKKAEPRVITDREFLEEDWIDGLRQVAPTPKGRYKPNDIPDNDASPEIISTHPYRIKLELDEPPPDDDIKISVIVPPSDIEPELSEDHPEPDEEEIWEDQFKPGDVFDRSYDIEEFEEMDPIEMQVIDRDEEDGMDAAETVAKWKHKKHRSRLEGLEPSDDSYVPKWFDRSEGEDLKSKLKDEKAEDWTEYLNDDKDEPIDVEELEDTKETKGPGGPEKIDEDGMDLEPMEIKRSTSKKKT